MKRIALLILIFIAAACPVFAYDFFVEDFEEGMPIAWTTEDNLGGTGGPWVDDNPGSRSGFSWLTDPFMIADSAWFSALLFDAVLISPVIDCSDWSNIYLIFGTDYNDASLDDSTLIEVTGDGGSNWSTVLTYYGEQPDHQEIIDISTIADGSENVIIKFIYSTGGQVNQGWWAVDDVTLQGNPVGNFIYLSPSHQETMGVIGEDVEYWMEIYNNTGEFATIDITYTGNSWPTSGPSFLDMSNQSSMPLWATVSIPISAAHGESDTVTVEASYGAYSASVTLTTTGVYYWTELDPVPTGRGDAAAAVDGTNVFFIGGTIDGGTPAGQVDIYDTDTGVWTTGTSMTTPMTNIASVGINGNIYVPGGYGASSILTTNLIYNVSGNSWSTGTDALNAYAGYAVVTDGTDVYRIGGCTAGQWGIGTVDLDRYDVAGNTWSERTDMPTGRVWPMAAHINGKIYVAGGLDETGTALDSLDVYDITSNTWNSVKSTLPGTWWGAGYGVYCEYFFVFGGILDGEVTEKTYYYDPESDTWTEVAFLNDPRFRLAGTGNDDIGLFAIGGWNPLWTAHDTFETYDRCLCGCFIDEICWDDGAVNPTNVCEFCDISQDQYSWSNNDGVSCDDEVWCNGEDTCLDGTCSDHEYGEGNPRCPDDTLYCNGDEFCDEDNDQCTATPEPCPNDGLWCTGIEGCDEDNDQCTNTGDPCPDDGLYCTGVEGCDEDNDQCTTTGDPCLDDGQWCNGEEFCDEENDTCDAENIPMCPDDGIFCNGDEICDEENDQCSHSGDPCVDDGAFCNGEESCDTEKDECVSSGTPCPADGLFCNGSESCDEENDECTHTGDPCNEGETCNEKTDSCDSPDEDDDDTDDDTGDDDAVDDDTDAAEDEEVKEGEKGGCTCG